MGRLQTLPVLLTVLATFPAAGAESAASSHVITFPALPGLPESDDYTITANGQPVLVYQAPVLNGGPASFAQFDFSGPVEVVITAREAALLPRSHQLTPRIQGNTVSFTLDRPRHVTLELNGRFERALHLFTNAPETDVPNPDDPRVRYFGPGVHEIGSTVIPSGTTVYLAGGAVVRGIIEKDEKPLVESNWLGNKVYRDLLIMEGVSDVVIRGRGVLDLSALPWHSRLGIRLAHSSRIRVEDLLILDAPGWVVGMFSSEDVTVRNLKQICARENSDGIDISNSRDVLVENCFLRNNDDPICVKTVAPPPEPESQRIRVRNCIIWNERARGLGITSETRAGIRDVTFENCDIIRDFSVNPECAALAILVSDSGTIRNIRFENIRIEHARTRLVNLWIGEDRWGTDGERGRIDGVVFKDIAYGGAGRPPILVTGHSPDHLVENVTFENLTFNGEPASDLASAPITANEHTRNIRIKGTHETH